MPAITVTFLGLEALSKRGDFDEFLFKFAYVDTSLVGSPEETGNTAQASVTARMSRSLQSTWKLGRPSLQKVLFEYARRGLVDRISAEGGAGSFAIDLNSSSAPQKNPYDPERISMVEGTRYQVDVSRPIRFRGT